MNLTLSAQPFQCRGYRHDMIVADVSFLSQFTSVITVRLRVQMTVEILRNLQLSQCECFISFPKNRTQNRCFAPIKLPSPPKNPSELTKLFQSGSCMEEAGMNDMDPVEIDVGDIFATGQSQSQNVNSYQMLTLRSWLKKFLWEVGVTTLTLLTYRILTSTVTVVVTY